MPAVALEAVRVPSSGSFRMDSARQLSNAVSDGSWPEMAGSGMREYLNVEARLARRGTSLLSPAGSQLSKVVVPEFC